jgi:hypothetical protein
LTVSRREGFVSIAIEFLAKQATKKMILQFREEILPCKSN